MSGEDLVEEVARALCEAEGLRWEDQGDPMMSGSGGDDRDAFRNSARAAIAVTLEAAAKVAERFTSENKRIHPDIRWDEMNEDAKAISHAACQSVADEIRSLLPSLTSQPR